jgi:AcrR family transcriptional regulator
MRSIDGLPLTEAVLMASIRTFIERGYEQTSMDEIATRARTTKRTVYAHFGSKEGLFRAAVAKAVALFQSQLPPLDPAGEPAAELEAFAARLCELCTWEGSVRLQRLVMGEADRFPDLGRMLHRDVIERTERLVADYLVALNGTGRLSPPPTDGDWSRTMAGLFFNMTTGPQRFETLLGACEPLPGPPGVGTAPGVDIASIRHAVWFFLSGCGRRTREPPV